MLERSTLRSWAEMDYSRIAHNVEEIQKLMGNTKIMGIVKANAYGLGAVACARALKEAGVDHFAVACLQEARELRDAGMEEPILVLGYTAPESLQEIHDLDLTQTIVSAEYADKLEAWAKEHNTNLKTHVKLDTGMNRTGILFQPQKQQKEELLHVYQLPHVQVHGIFSHFPVSDDLSEDSVTFTTRQMELFDEAVEFLKANGVEPGLRHIQNSYGILNYGDRGYDYCRPGLLYMGVTSDDAVPILSDPDFWPVLSLKTKVSMVKEILPGMSVSYGRHFMAKKPTRIASLVIGYADGLPRACSNKGLQVLIHGQKAPIVGNICMDQCMVDVTDIPNVQEGDIAMIVGEEEGNRLTVDEITRLAGTINNETLTRLTSRVPRVDISELK